MRAAGRVPATMHWATAARADQEAPKETTRLGRSGLTVSRLRLGTMNFGPEISESDSHAIMDAAAEAGINFPY